MPESQKESDEQAPRTEAGKALAGWLAFADSRLSGVPKAKTVRAIEEQAATEARAEAIQVQLDDMAVIVAEKVAEARRELLAKVRTKVGDWMAAAMLRESDEADAMVAAFDLVLGELDLFIEGEPA
jgi:hypothetical protein